MESIDIIYSQVVQYFLTRDETYSLDNDSVLYFRVYTKSLALYVFII